jgi:molybdopterin synthase catalytic subunit
MIRVSVRLFAMLRERAGSGSLELELPDGATAADVWPALALGAEPPALAYAVNRAYAARDRTLAEGDEVALIPPVSGGSPTPTIAIVGGPIDLGALVGTVANPAAGAIATFSGTVRAASRGRDVVLLDYEVYEEMAIAELERLTTAIAARHELLGIGVVHRRGRCEIGDTTVAIACSAEHRAPALAACAETIEALKASAPIWKREHYVDGAVWVGQGS